MIQPSMSLDYRSYIGTRVTGMVTLPNNSDEIWIAIEDALLYVNFMYVIFDKCI